MVALVNPPVTSKSILLQVGTMFSIVLPMVDGTDNASSQHPPIAGVRRSFVVARGVRFHLTEAGAIGGRPVVFMSHPWQSSRTHRPHIWRILAYQPARAAFGIFLQRHTKMVERVAFGTEASRGATSDPADVRIFAERFREPLCRKAARDDYRAFLLSEVPSAARRAENLPATVPIRALAKQ